MLEFNEFHANFKSEMLASDVHYVANRMLRNCNNMLELKLVVVKIIIVCSSHYVVSTRLVQVSSPHTYTHHEVTS